MKHRNISMYFLKTDIFIFMMIYAAGNNVEVKNWPQFFPLIHHDIPKEIPVQQQRTQYVAFTTLLGM